MKRAFVLRGLALVLALACAGCGTRSISDSGYRGGSWGHAVDDNPLYRGELSEFEVLGIERDRPIAEGEIQVAAKSHVRPTVAYGASVMLIQSGAMFPDEPMARALAARYAIGQFSGIPESRLPQDSAAAMAGSYAKSLRLAAARGGYDGIIAYWGVLETAQEDLAGKAISWVPIVGSFVPDEAQRMRIRLKFAVIDVKTGHWDLYVPEPLQDDAISARLNRASSDQSQVALLKDAAYEAAAAGLFKRCATPPAS
jgi:hypothetical protein